MTQALEHAPNKLRSRPFNYYSAASLQPLAEKYWFQIGQAQKKSANENTLSILDIGGRTGEWARAITNQACKLNIALGPLTVIDKHREALDRGLSEKSFHPIRFVELDLRQWKNGLSLIHEQYDVIFCLGTFCYIPTEEQEAILATILSCLKPEGELWLSYPKYLNFPKWYANPFLFYTRALNYLQNSLPFLITFGAKILHSFSVEWRGRHVGAWLDNHLWSGLIGLFPSFFNFLENDEMKIKANLIVWYGKKNETLNWQPLLSAKTSVIWKFCSPSRGEA